MRRSPNSNHYFMFGILFGLFISFYIPQNLWNLVKQEECPQEVAEINRINKFGHDFEPRLNLINKPLSAKKQAKNVIRPRYYSSELGIREKVFIGVMTSQDNINTLATAINRTSAHLVNKIKFFINADNVKTNYKLKNIVGFTDTRENLRPFHMIKYIADNYLEDYDYFVIIPDTVYVDARKLKLIISHISITFDLYMGSITKSDPASHVNSENIEIASNDEFKMFSDRSYCDFNAGIILSSSVIRNIRNNLDWCVRNGITNVHSINLGRCVKYSSKLSRCQEIFQDIRYQTYAIEPGVKIYNELKTLARNDSFKYATSFFPITNSDDYYRLHAYFSKYILQCVQSKGNELEQKAYRISNISMTDNILQIRWPLGVPTNSVPENRHDIITWQLLNRTHIFLPNSENVVEPLRRIDLVELKKVLAITLKYAAYKFSNLKFSSVHTIYRKFDAIRGLDYVLHLNFRDRKAHVLSKTFQVVKPLGRIEVVPSPYVTESTRIAILVPTFEHQINDAVNFIIQYENVCMRNQDNTFLLMIFLYRYDSSSRGETDPFKRLKTLALDLSSKYKADGSRIAWVSTRLPLILSDPKLTHDLLINSLYARCEFLSLVVADLALPKIGLDSLVLMGSTSMVFKADFLNRVRMNTIQGFQVYSPVGFMLYPCKLSHFCKECASCDVSQATGYFDKWNNDIISFYSRDYVQARKRIESSLPIVYNDNDIMKILTRPDKAIKTILDMFVHSQLPVHVLRGVEPNLRFDNSIRFCFDDGADILKCPVQEVESYTYSTERFTNSFKYFNNNRNNAYEDLVRNNSMQNYIFELLNTRQCMHLASRKHIGDTIIRFEDKSIL